MIKKKGSGVYPHLREKHLVYTTSEDEDSSDSASSNGSDPFARAAIAFAQFENATHVLLLQEAIERGVSLEQHVEDLKQTELNLVHHEEPFVGDSSDDSDGPQLNKGVQDQVSPTPTPSAPSPTHVPPTASIGSVPDSALPTAQPHPVGAFLAQNQERQMVIVLLKSLVQILKKQREIQQQIPETMTQG